MSYFSTLNPLLKLVLMPTNNVVRYYELQNLLFLGKPSDCVVAILVTPKPTRQDKKNRCNNSSKEIVNLPVKMNNHVIAIKTNKIFAVSQAEFSRQVGNKRKCTEKARSQSELWGFFIGNLQDSKTQVTILNVRVPIYSSFKLVLHVRPVKSIIRPQIREHSIIGFTFPAQNHQI